MKTTDHSLTDASVVNIFYSHACETGIYPITQEGPDNLFLFA